MTNPHIQSYRKQVGSIYHILRYLRENKLSETYNFDLLLNKYYKGGDDPDQKRGFLQELVYRANQNQLFDISLYRKYFRKYYDALEILYPHNQQQKFKTTRRAVVGLGTDSILETNIKLQHTYGLPIIPGQALKGMCSHFCDEMLGEIETKFKKDQNYYHFLFGSTEKQGIITFADSLITPSTFTRKNMGMKMDIMTPHHPDYYSNPEKKNNKPTDFDSPTPIPFISIRGVFQIFIAWNNAALVNSSKINKDKIQDWVTDTMKILQMAFKERGIGAKTNVGYGYLEPLK